MSKVLKITLIALIISIFICSFVYATDIDLNLTDNEYSSESIDDETDNLNDSSITTKRNESNYAGSSSTSNDDSDIDNDADATVVSSISTVSSTGLGFSNILNILLIVVGIILILLCVAILIKLFS